MDLPLEKDFRPGSSVLFTNLNADKVLETFQRFTLRSTGETPTRLLKVQPGMGRWEQAAFSTPVEAQTSWYLVVCRSCMNWHCKLEIEKSYRASANLPSIWWQLWHVLPIFCTNRFAPTRVLFWRKECGCVCCSSVPFVFLSPSSCVPGRVSWISFTVLAIFWCAHDSQNL